MPYSSLPIANRFIGHAQQAGGLITHMKAQKLVYLAHGLNLAMADSALVEEQFEAWTFGPVIRRLYDSLKKYGKSPLSRFIRWGDDTPLAQDGELEEAIAQISRYEADLIGYVWNAYGNFSAFQLSALTHLEGTPWHSAYVKGENKPIDNNSIKGYFVRLSNGELQTP